MFETKRARGRFLLLLAAAIVVVVLVGNRWVSTAADDRAMTTEARVRAALEDVRFPDILMPQEGGSLGEAGVRTLRSDGDGIRVTADTGLLWQFRCVVGRADPAGHVTTSVLKQDCR